MTKRPKKRTGLRDIMKRVRQDWQRAVRRDARLKARYGNDPKHKHTREEMGRYGPVTGGFAVVLYWCKVCHADMDQKVIKVPLRTFAKRKKSAEK